MYGLTLSTGLKHSPANWHQVGPWIKQKANLPAYVSFQVEGTSHWSLGFASSDYVGWPAAMRSHLNVRTMIIRSAYMRLWRKSSSGAGLSSEYPDVFDVLCAPSPRVVYADEC
jgi:hypothetical protein